MCIPGLDPVTLGLALTLGSTGLNMAAQNKAARARDSALTAEKMRQDKLKAEADTLNDGSRERYEGFSDQQDQKASNLADYFQEAPQSATEAVGEANASAANVMPSAGTNDIVLREMDKKAGEAKAFTDQQGAARGELRSFGDLLGGVSREQARDAGYIGQINGFRSGSADVLPYELEAANNKGAGLRTFADILGGLGGVATTSGLTSAAAAGRTPSLFSWPSKIAAPSYTSNSLGSLW